MIFLRSRQRQSLLFRKKGMLNQVSHPHKGTQCRNSSLELAIEISLSDVSYLAYPYPYKRQLVLLFPAPGRAKVGISNCISRARHQAPKNLGQIGREYQAPCLLLMRLQQIPSSKRCGSWIRKFSANAKVQALNRSTSEQNAEIFNKKPRHGNTEFRHF